MKINQRSLHTNSESQAKQYKSIKKLKGPKRTAEKLLKTTNTHDVQDKISEPKSPNPDDKNLNEGDLKSISDVGLTDTKSDSKKNQAEKRKQEGSEWKPLKKIDYQRLETVVEEGQLSCEESPSKPNCEEDPKKNKDDSDSCFPDGACTRARQKKLKPKLHNLPPTSEPLEDCTMTEDLEKPQPSKMNVFEIEESSGEPVESYFREPERKHSSIKKNLNLQGMMEILPIFSNDKFVCSRDAISIEEYEDFESLDKNGTPSGNSFKKEGTSSQDFDERATERIEESKDLIGRKLRYKILTDKNLSTKTSSHFINSLLILSPFAAEKEKLLQGDKLKDVNKQDFSKNKQFVKQAGEIEGDAYCNLKGLPAFLFTTLGLFSVCLGFAWKSYEPPCMLDYILEFIPFIHRRRTLIQLFFDELIKILSNVFGA